MGVNGLFHITNACACDDVGFPQVYHIKYAHVFVRFCFVVVIFSVLTKVDSSDAFPRILERCFTSCKARVFSNGLLDQLPQPLC